jgi:hypothetical protein
MRRRRTIHDAWGEAVSEAGLAVFVLVAFLIPVPVLVWLDRPARRSGAR